MREDIKKRLDALCNWATEVPNSLIESLVEDAYEAGYEEGIEDADTEEGDE